MLEIKPKLSHKQNYLNYLRLGSIRKSTFQKKKKDGILVVQGTITLGEGP